MKFEICINENKTGGKIKINYVMTRFYSKEENGRKNGKQVATFMDIGYTNMIYTYYNGSVNLMMHNNNDWTQ